MTALRSTVARLFGRLAVEVQGAPAAEFTFAPATAEEAAAILDLASEHRLVVLPWGGGTHQFGHPVHPDIVLSTAALTGFDWRADDLTLVVGAGESVAWVEERLAERGQSAILPEHPGAATIGGVVAAGVSGWRRLRYGATRERVLEVVVATGDGRVIRGGGQVVKNVTGFDLPRLFTGSLGSLGVITRVALKLWPIGAATATVMVDDPDRALATAWRPLAVLETAGSTSVYLAGTATEVEAQAASLRGTASPGLSWPEPPTGQVTVAVRVPPADTGAARDRIAGLGGFVAAHGVGEVLAAGDAPRVDLAAVRAWAEARGGSLAVLAGDAGIDPWGTPPTTLDLQRRVKQAFDPLRVLVPGRLPGGI